MRNGCSTLARMLACRSVLSHAGLTASACCYEAAAQSVRSQGAVATWELFNEFVRWFRDFQDIWLTLLAIFVFYLLILNARRSRINRRAVDPELGELIWVDEGRQIKPFFDHEFKVPGKPDVIYNKKGHITTLDFKSRRGPILDSDRVQALTAALAAPTGGYKVREALIRTKTMEETFELPKDDLSLMLQPYVEPVRRNPNTDLVHTVLTVSTERLNPDYEINSCAQSGNGLRA